MIITENSKRGGFWSKNESETNSGMMKIAVEKFTGVVRGFFYVLEANENYYTYVFMYGNGRKLYRKTKGIATESPLGCNGSDYKSNIFRYSNYCEEIMVRIVYWYWDADYQRSLYWRGREVLWVNKSLRYWSELHHCEGKIFNPSLNQIFLYRRKYRDVVKYIVKRVEENNLSCYKVMRNNLSLFKFVLSIEYSHIWSRYIETVYVIPMIQPV